MALNDIIHFWPDDFAPATVFTSYDELKKYPGYYHAKKGDLQKAIKLVGFFVNEQNTSQLKTKFSDATKVPVSAQEKVGVNYLPLALAIRVCALTSISYTDEIIVINKAERTNQNGMYRLLNRSIFFGRVISGQKYIIADDMIAQGGTINDLRKFIEKGGGKVVHAVAIASGLKRIEQLDSRFLKISESTISELYSIFGIVINNIISYYGIANQIEELTESKALYILGFPEVNTFISVLLSQNKM